MTCDPASAAAGGLARCHSCGRVDSLEVGHCPRCHALFQREEGFFVGAITINVVTTELFILVLYFICLLLLSSSQMMLAILFVMALLFPIAFYHHSWSIWLSLDHLVETLPHYRDADKHTNRDVPGKS